MNQLSIRLAIAVMTFAAGASAATAWLIFHGGVRSTPAVTLCDLFDDPQNNYGKRVRVKAILYSSAAETGILYDPACGGAGECAHVRYNLTAYTEAEAALRQATRFEERKVRYSQRSPLLDRTTDGYEVGSGRVGVTFEGELYSSEDGAAGSVSRCPVEFHVAWVEEVEPVAPDVPWP